jgi:hypothetical protein
MTSTLACIIALLFLLNPAALAQDSRLAAPRWEYDAYAKLRRDVEWDEWQERIRRDLLVSAGLWPEPTRTPLRAVVHSRRGFQGYSTSDVYFQSMSGHFVTGTLYRPDPVPDEPMPIVLCPYGHWPQGRFMDYENRRGHYGAKTALESGGEVSMTAARSMLQARCVQLARMGCAVLLYDMIGRADSLQMSHPDEAERWENPGEGENWVLESPRALGHLQSMFGLQLWNGMRAIDFMEELEGTDPDRVFVTGASGGGKQSLFLFAADPRVTAAVAGVALGGGRFETGCLCGKAPYLLVGHGLVDLAVSGAPRPFAFALSGGAQSYRDAHLLPYLKRAYAHYGAADSVEVFVNTGYGHTYNLHARRHMYRFINRHLKLGLEPPIGESEFTFLTEEELTVWDEEHPAPPESNRGRAHERKVCRWWADDAREQIEPLLAPRTPRELARSRKVLGAGWRSILAHTLPEPDDVSIEWTTEGGDARGIVRNALHGEQVGLRVRSPEQVKGRMLVLSDSGVQALDKTSMQRHLDAGWQLVGCDLFLQANSEARPEESPGSQCAPNGGKVRKGKHAAPGNIYAVHPPLFARRVHDILTVLAALKEDPVDGDKPIRLLAMPGTGPLAAAALAVDEDAAASARIDMDHFRFSEVQDVWAEDFLPGALKYGDVRGLLLQAGPCALEVRGMAPADARALERAFGLMGGRASFESHER